MLSIETAKFVGLIGGIIAAICYLVMAVAFFVTGQWQVGSAYVAYAVSNIFLSLLLI